ncbi:prefoldin subunit 6 [Flagelloscypha sp. PMI_526]|nr:prefoldin subunit 6 [Flagelloscypha sp. PMI_526]
MSLQVKLQSARTEFQKIQSDYSTMVDARQKLDAQLTETENVKKEFESLTPDNIVYKQIGPVLVKQEHGEAKSTVNTRLEFIRSEVKRVEGQLKDLQESSEKKKAEIVEIQTALEQQQQQQQPISA